VNDLLKIKDINNFDLSEFPVDHLVIDDFFSDTYLKEVLDNFPEINGNNDLRGNNNFYLLNDIEKLDIGKCFFWKDFIKKILPQIVKKLSLKFTKNISPKFKKLIEDKHKLIYGTLMLSENAADKTDFCPHYHFDNDPLWFMTFLIYLEDKNNNAPGTTFYSLNKNISQLDLNVDINRYIGFNNIRQNKKISYEEQIKVMKGHLSEFDRKTIEFKPNRLFSFYDDFRSIHSVEYDKNENNHNVKRKTIRVSIGFDRNLCENIYQTDINSFSSFFKSNNEKFIRKTFNQELDCLKNKQKTDLKSQIKNLEVQDLSF
tara:strand:- start:399 stop:1343 length:945 start_codon:yes stop_codon:yes gene_type:complete